jgi:hypothetical protein
MILRAQLARLFEFALFLAFLGTSFAEDNPFDCHLTVNSLAYDLTKLTGEHTISRTRETPPSSMFDLVRLDLCEDLKTKESIDEKDQCSKGTRVCLTTTNKKGDDPDRVVAVIPIAETALLKPEFKALSSPKGLGLIFRGSPYPDPSDSLSTSQFLNLTLLCATETSSLKFVSYDGSQLKLEWSAPPGCADETAPPASDPSDGKDDDKNIEENVGSGIGWFFLVLLLAFFAYFGLGAYYNYSTYGASGADLIPHRDFWKEVPYMLRDVVAHLCSNVRPRRAASRGGYIAV